MLQSISSVFVVYRHKTLTGSPDPTHANGTDKPCMGQGSGLGLDKGSGKLWARAQVKLQTRGHLPISSDISGKELY